MFFPIAGFLCAGLMTNLAWAGHAVTHAWSMEHGSLLANWSFENEHEVWSDSTTGGLAATARQAPSGFAARSGRFAGRVAGTTSTSGEILLMRAGRVPVLAGQAYTLSFYVRSTGSVGGGCFPAVRLMKDRATLSRTVNGSAYASFSGSSTIGTWTLYTLAFTTDANEIQADIALWRSASSGVAATLFFDDVILEEGSVSSEQAAAYRARHAYTVSRTDALAKDHQTHTRLPDQPDVYRITGILYDSAGRPVKTPLPVTGGLAFDPNLVAAANAYYNGSDGVPDAGGHAWAEVKYAAEPSTRVLKSAAPGEPWKLAGGKTAAGGFYFVENLVPPANIEHPAADNNERSYRLDWYRDEDSVFALSWSNRRGHVVQVARQAGVGQWARTRYEYHPTGQVRRVLTPLDVEGGGDGFAEVRQFNAQGLLTSSWTTDRGLERFWYNRRGMLRFSQNDRQRESSSQLFTYFDYDHRGNMVSTGEQMLPYTVPNQESGVDGNGAGYEFGKVESRGYLYGSLDDFESRTGIPLDSVLFPLLSPSLVAAKREGALMAAWHRNPDSDVPGVSAFEKFVVDLYAYDDKGRVAGQYKYIGPIRDRDKRIHVIAYGYDAADRLVSRTAYEGGMGPSGAVMMHQTLAYDALGRVTVITAGGDTVAQYAYAPHGGLESVTIGEPASGTVVEYDYHVRGWTKRVSAIRNGNGFLIYQQALGYEDRALDGDGVPPLIAARHTGKISQQIYKFTTDVPNPVRVINYDYNHMGQMTTSDYRHGSGLDGEQYLQYPFSLTEADDLDTRMAYDLNGRIQGKRSGGVSSTDSAVYGYYADSHRLMTVSGRLTATGHRDASKPENFGYDAEGRMTRDLSRNLEVSYGLGARPVEFSLRDGHRETALHDFHDAEGLRVSQVVVSRKSRGFPAYWVGIAEEDEDPGLYAFPEVAAALDDAHYRLNVLDAPAPDSLVLYVVPGFGETGIARGTGTLDALGKGDTIIPVILRGVTKFSAAYYSLMAERAGTPVRARHMVILGGMAQGEIRESYDENGDVGGRAVVATVFGRGTPIGRYLVDSARFQFFIKNHQGSTVRVVNADGSYATTPVYDYMPYGELQVIREDSANPVGARYTGKGIDTELNLYDFGARWYDQELGVWMTPDPARQFVNPYSYGGDPVNYFDPTGLWSLGLGIVVGYENGSWHYGFGVAADFREEVGFGANASYVWNEDGSRTTTIGAVVPVPVGNVVLYGGAGYTHNTDNGHTGNAVVGVSNKDGTLGAEIGTNHSWDNDGNYLGGNVYGQGYAGHPALGVKAGYRHGWGGYESGPYANARLGGFSWSADQNGVRYDGFATSATAGYGWGEGQGFYADYPGQGIVAAMVGGGGSQTDPLPPAESGPHVPRPGIFKSMFGTNFCGDGTSSSFVTGALDAACRIHDHVYTRYKADGLTGALFKRQSELAMSDLQLAMSAYAAMNENVWGGIGVGTTFSVIGAYKVVSHSGGNKFKDGWY